MTYRFRSRAAPAWLVALVVAACGGGSVGDAGLPANVNDNGGVAAASVRLLSATRVAASSDVARLDRNRIDW